MLEVAWAGNAAGGASLAGIATAAAEETGLPVFMGRQGD
jgi:hypothetical protein